MTDYLVFGSCLRSELPFPELSETRGREPRWTLTLGSLASADEGEILCDTQLSGGCRIRISRDRGNVRFSHSCAGTFELRDHGRKIVFDAERAASVDAARTDLVARLLLMFADQNRVTWLHGSAARIGRGAVAFIGASGAGKSTIALALARAGADHICDDALPIEAGKPPVVWPSDGTVRLCGDTKQRFAPAVDSVRRESDGKFVMTRRDLQRDDAQGRNEPLGDLPGVDSQQENSRTHLSAIYVLAPVHADGPAGGSHTGVSRRLLAPSAALPLLIQNLKLGALLQPDYPVRTMEQLASVVRQVPVYELAVPRDWSRVGDVVSRLFDWHDQSSAVPMNAQTAGITT